MSGGPSAARGRTGAALGLGALAGVLVAVPALSRLTQAGVGGGTALAALAGGSALLLGPVLALLDRAHAQGARLPLLLTGLGLSAWPIARLGSVLEATTHHRPLGAATFAILALALVLGCLLVAFRVARLELAHRTAGRVASLVVVALSLASTALVLVPALRTPGVRPHAADAMSLVVAGALGWAALRRRGSVPWLSRAGVPLWTTLVVGHLLLTATPAFHVVREHAPVLSGPAAWL